MTQSIPQPEVFAFLLGEGPLEGTHFGDKHPTHQGNFWWRKHLRAALAAQPLVGAIPEGNWVNLGVTLPEPLLAFDDWLNAPPSREVPEPSEAHADRFEAYHRWERAVKELRKLAISQPLAVQQDRGERPGVYNGEPTQDAPSSAESCLSKMADFGQQNRLYPEFEKQGAAREPLTEEQIEKIGRELDGDGSAYPFFLAEKKKRVGLVRRVEAHFGIKATS